MKKLLITGAGGLLGSHVCEAAAKRGYRVFGLVRGSEKKVKHLLNLPNFSVVRGDITNYKKIFAILKKIKPNGVLHTAALYTPKKIDKPFPFHETNTTGTINLLEACRVNNVKKIIYISSMSVYDKKRIKLPVSESHSLGPNNFYGTSKLTAEQWCELYAKVYGINIIILRCSGIYGPRRSNGAVSNFVKNAINEKTIFIENNVSWDMVHVADVGEASLAALRNASKLHFEIINIGSGQEIGIVELAKQIIKLAKSPSKIKYGKYFTQTASFRFYFDIHKAKKLLNFKPRPITAGLKSYVRSLKRKTV